MTKPANKSEEAEPKEGGSHLTPVKHTGYYLTVKQGKRSLHRSEEYGKNRG